MTRSLGGALPASLVARLSQRELDKRLGIALPFVTVDGDGRPHPMVVSYVEVRAYDASALGLVIGAQSRSARNLEERRTGTLLLLEPDLCASVKTRAVDGPLPVAADGGLGLGYFLLAVEDVLEDRASDWEDGMRITSPLRYAPPPSLDAPWVRATLAALAVPRARA